MFREKYPECELADSKLYTYALTVKKEKPLPDNSRVSFWDQATDEFLIECVLRAQVENHRAIDQGLMAGKIAPNRDGTSTPLRPATSPRSLSHRLVQLFGTESPPQRSGNKSEKLIVSIYVDDGLIAGSTQIAVDLFLKTLASEFKIVMGSLDSFLGIQIEQRDQQQDKTTNGPLDSSIPYRSAVGSLMYLACATRPDIAYAVSKVARSMAEPTTFDWISSRSGSLQAGRDAESEEFAAYITKNECLARPTRCKRCKERGQRGCKKHQCGNREDKRRLSRRTRKTVERGKRRSDKPSNNNDKIAQLTYAATTSKPTYSIRIKSESKSQTADETREQFRNAIDPTVSEIEIEKCKRIGNVAIMVTVNNKEDVEKIRVAVAANTKYQVKEVPKNRPRVKVFPIDESMEENEIIWWLDDLNDAKNTGQRHKVCDRGNIAEVAKDNIKCHDPDRVPKSQRAR
ncbi:hypothetical protein CBL_20409 [Carabus blaptoides fortunei]